MVHKQKYTTQKHQVCIFFLFLLRQEKIDFEMSSIYSYMYLGHKELIVYWCYPTNRPTLKLGPILYWVFFFFFFFLEKQKKIIK